MATPVNKTVFTQDQIEEAIQLVQQGFGRYSLGEALEIGVGSAERLINEIKNGVHGEVEIPKVRIGAQALKIQSLKNMGLSNYDIANSVGTTIKSITTTLEKTEEKYLPAQEKLKRELSRGIKLSRLKEVYSIKTLEKARKAILDIYPDSFISEIKEDGDTLLTPVTDGSREIESLKIDKSKRDFDYYVAPSKNYMYVKFRNLKAEEIKVWIVSDVHVGSKVHREDLFDEMIEQISKEKNAYAVLAGDMIENINKLSVGDPMDQNLTINEQVRTVVKKLSPISHKILAFLDGNHEERTERFVQVSLSQIMADILQVPYFKAGVTIDYELAGRTFCHYHTHRYGKSTYARSAIVAKVKQMYSSMTFPVHWFGSGHTHSASIDEEIHKVKIPGKGFDFQRFFVVNSGSLTQDTGTYVEQAGFPPSAKDTTYIWFKANGEYGADRVRINPI